MSFSGIRGSSFDDNAGDEDDPWKGQFLAHVKSESEIEDRYIFSRKV